MTSDREPLAGILAALKKMSEKRSTGLVPCDDKRNIQAVKQHRQHKGHTNETL